MMDESEKFSKTKQVIQFLSDTFPACFSTKGDAKPLKIGVFHDLVAFLKEDTRLSRTLLRSSLRYYTNSWRYLHSIKEGVHRVGLDGTLVDKVEKKHEEHAQLQLKESKQKFADRRKQRQEHDTIIGGQNNIDHNLERYENNSRNKPKRDAEKNAKNNGLKVAGRNVTNTLPEMLSTRDLVAGTKVTVKVGKIPMPASIVEVAKDGIRVILESGMQLKVRQDNLRLASEKDKL